MKFLNRRRPAAVAVNLTPLLDCMFLLVIFILLAARFEPSGGIAVNLPSASAKAPEPAKTNTINLTIAGDGTMFLEKEPVPLENLEQAIVAARNALGDPDGENTVLVIQGDRDTRHGRVVEALDEVTRAKQKKVVIRTRPESE